MLAHYKTWADQVMFDGVAALPPGEARKERKTLFKTMSGTLNHIYVVDLIWQAHLERRDHGFNARNVLVHAELSTLWPRSNRSMPGSSIGRRHRARRALTNKSPSPSSRTTKPR
jgi:hypothetical protein